MLVNYRRTVSVPMRGDVNSELIDDSYIGILEGYDYLYVVGWGDWGVVRFESWVQVIGAVGVRIWIWIEMGGR